MFKLASNEPLIQFHVEAKLLKKDGQAFRRTQEKNGIHLWNIDSFIIYVDHKNELDLLRYQTALHMISNAALRFCNEKFRGDLEFVKDLRHEFCMLFGETESNADDVRTFEATALNNKLISWVE